MEEWENKFSKDHTDSATLYLSVMNDVSNSIQLLLSLSDWSVVISKSRGEFSRQHGQETIHSLISKE
jgi:hypothetical protein